MSHLVLTRRKGDSVVLTQGSTTIEVSVVRLQGDRVRLSFKAPEDVVILRNELIGTPPKSQAGSEVRS